MKGRKKLRQMRSAGKRSERFRHEQAGGDPWVRGSLPFHIFQLSTPSPSSPLEDCNQTLQQCGTGSIRSSPATRCNMML